jgi:hypothetical protein
MEGNKKEEVEDMIITLERKNRLLRAVIGSNFQVIGREISVINSENLQFNLLNRDIFSNGVVSRDTASSWTARLGVIEGNKKEVNHQV